MGVTEVSRFSNNEFLENLLELESKCQWPLIHIPYRFLLFTKCFKPIKKVFTKNLYYIVPIYRSMGQKNPWQNGAVIWPSSNLVISLSLQFK